MSTPTFPFVSRIQAYVARASSPIEMLDQISVKSSIVRKGGEIVALGSVTHQLITIGDGIAMRYRLLPDGGRQIIMFLVPGDVCSINIFNAVPSDHAVAAVTAVRVDRIDQEAMLDILKVMPSVNAALWHMADEQNALMRDHITSLGRCDSRLRIAALLHELVLRFRTRGPSSDPVAIPITQSLLADAVGVTHIHFNRIVGEFCRTGILSTQRGTLVVRKPSSLAALVQPLMAQSLASLSSLQPGTRVQ